tara:strand:- start:40 stop:258 length:219 start_codon:yes stop_codon:yes gene_type:complete
MTSNASELMNRNVEIRFEPSTGRVYYLYERTDNSRFLSILSPEEWEQGRFYKDFLAQVMVDSSGSWKLVSKE